jgi:hypothetical protein
MGVFGVYANVQRIPSVKPRMPHNVLQGRRRMLVLLHPSTALTPLSLLNCHCDSSRLRLCYCSYPHTKAARRSLLVVLNVCKNYKVRANCSD